MPINWTSQTSHCITSFNERKRTMSKICKTPKESSEAIKANTEEITVEADMANHIICVKATGIVSWAVCAASLAVAASLIAATPTVTAAATPAAGEACFLAGTVTSVAAVGVLGPSAIPAIAIAVASGGVGALTAIRDKYTITEKTSKYIKLKRKR